VKVLQIVKTNEGATWAFNQAKWLHEHGVDIITILPCIHGGMAERYISNGMLIIEADLSLPISKPWKLFKKIGKIRKMINDIKPDLIHCHFVTNILMLRLALRSSRIPRVFQVPGPLHLESWLFRKGEIVLSKANDYWVGSCKKTCQIYKDNGISQRKIFLSYYGNYSIKVEEQYTKSQDILHNEYNLNKDCILVGMISYFYKPKKHLLQSRGLKGHEDFIEAIALVREKYPTVKGIIIGDAWGNAKKYVEKVKRYANEKCKDGIVFIGFRNDIKKIYRELDIAVHPSHSENLGGASESLAAGVPTVSTNIGGFPDIVIDRQTGYTVNPKCPSEIAEAIIKIISNEYEVEEMSRRGMQLVTNMLNIENTGKSILSVYRKILNGDST